MSKTVFNYEPDYAVAPGEILEETLTSRGMQKVDLAERCGLSAKQMSLIISGKAPVTPETAINFERALGISANIWNNLEAKFRLHHARKQNYEELSKHKDWLRRFPINELERRGIIKRDDKTAKRVAQLLDFFGVGGVASWQERYERLQVAFRRSPAFKSSLEAVVTWLRIGELKAAALDCAPYDKSKFDLALNEIRRLSCKDPNVFEPRMKELCANSGVALVFVGELPGTHLSGATRWLQSDKALIELSLRYKTDDHLWFTFFHEAGHVKLHGKKGVFIDEDKQTAFSNEEQEADQFAANRLIPKKAYSEFIEAGEYNESNIREFAEALGIASGIVVGRLQHDGLIPWNTSLSSHLKCHFELVETASE
jgi:addiction module HigA family antidote